MASNPIKRRARQSFFIGFLIALVIMAVFVMLLFTKIDKLNQENEKLKVVGPKVSVYTLNRDIEEGEQIKLEDLQSSTMQLTATSTAINTEGYIDPSIFSGEDDDGNEIELSYTAKVKINAGSVATLSMLKEDAIANDERLMEYNMILLPTKLVTGDYIDIRLRLADGSEKIVLSKKKVQACTANSIWMKMKEIEILTMNSAIVDAYIVPGSQLRATVYTNPIMQDAIEVTYPVNNDVLNEININPNILYEAKVELSKKWSKVTNTDSGVSDYRVSRTEIDSSIDMDQKEIKDAVSGAYDTEASNINTSRSEYISELEETGLVGSE